jgi:hypothetical protein
MTFLMIVEIAGKRASSRMIATTTMRPTPNGVIASD